jgi:hypothetical protein
MENRKPSEDSKKASLLHALVASQSAGNLREELTNFSSI